MDRLVTCLIIPFVIWCCCIHSTAQKDNSELSGWGEWGDWSVCSTSCGYGMQTRTRTWIYAPGEYNSEDAFTGTDIIQCFLKHCPVNGSWTQWGIWGDCSKGCGGGIRNRYRSCSEPEPTHGGANCTGKMYNEGECHKNPCPPLPLNFNVSQCSSSSMFTCSSQKMCVKQVLRCDGEAHCHDGSDEMACRRSNIGHVRFSNASPCHSSSCMTALMAVLFSSWLVKLFIGGQRCNVDQSALRP